MQKRVAHVHHPDQAMPWEDEDVVVEESGCDAARMKCPLTQNVIDTPLTCTQCGHSFERDAILQYVTNKRGQTTTKPCPVAGCNAQINPNENLKQDPELEVKLQRYKAQAEQRKKDLRRKALQMSQSSRSQRKSRSGVKPDPESKPDPDSQSLLEQTIED